AGPPAAKIVGRVPAGAVTALGKKLGSKSRPSLALVPCSTGTGLNFPVENAVWRSSGRIFVPELGAMPKPPKTPLFEKSCAVVSPWRQARVKEPPQNASASFWANVLLRVW